MNQMASPQNVGLFQRALVMSGIIRSPYAAGGFGTPNTLENAEKNGAAFVEFLGCKSIDEARKIDAKTVLAKYNEFGRRMFGVQDGKFLVGDASKFFLEGKYVNVPVMAGNTADEFHSGIMAKTPEEYVAKVKEIFGDRAEEFLALDEAKFDESGFSARTAGIEQSIKAMFAERKKSGNEMNGYYYRFEPDIPGWDNPGTFHSVDLWFFFETLAKCWRPFVGRHYDLARQMANYLVNFIKTGDPNGIDADGTQMPEWKPFNDETPVEMRFTSEGAKPETENVSKFSEMLREKVIESLKN